MKSNFWTRKLEKKTRNIILVTIVLAFVIGVFLLRWLLIKLNTGTIVTIQNSN